MRKGSSRDAGSQSVAEVDHGASSEPATDPEGSAPRTRVPEALPTDWVDRLLLAVLELPLSEGESAVVEAMVDSVAAILPSYAVGVCLAASPHVGGGGDQIVVKRVPEGTVERVAGIHPTRIFPGFGQECAVDIPGGSPGSTMHIASNEHEIDEDGSPAARLVERAARVLGRALSTARTARTLPGAPQSAAVIEERMVQADKLATFGQIAAGVVHELNNPLTSIVAYADYLIRKAVVDGSYDPADVERLRRIGESANRMLRISRELVQYARPSTRPSGAVILHAVIDQAVAFCEHVLSVSGVAVERRYVQDPLTVPGVSERLVQVFVNLLTNACQAAPAVGGRVLITTAHEVGLRRRVLVAVEDNGSGIAPDNLPHVFVPFFTTRGDKQGTGLGLSIVKTIVDHHDGEIAVESQPGLGTRFVVALPLARERAAT